MSVVNFVKTGDFFNGQIASFLLNIDNEHDLPYFNEIQCLSCHRTWEAYYGLMIEFFKFW